MGTMKACWIDKCGRDCKHEDFFKCKHPSVIDNNCGHKRWIEDKDKVDGFPNWCPLPDYCSGTLEPTESDREKIFAFLRDYMSLCEKHRIVFKYIICAGEMIDLYIDHPTPPFPGGLTDMFNRQMDRIRESMGMTAEQWVAFGGPVMGVTK